MQRKGAKSVSSSEPVVNPFQNFVFQNCPQNSQPFHLSHDRYNRVAFSRRSSSVLEAFQKAEEEKGTQGFRKRSSKKSTQAFRKRSESVPAAKKAQRRSESVPDGKKRYTVFCTALRTHSKSGAKNCGTVFDLDINTKIVNLLNLVM